jgi:hypothetical protein
MMQVHRRQIHGVCIMCLPIQNLTADILGIAKAQNLFIDRASTRSATGLSRSEFGPLIHAFTASSKPILAQLIVLPTMVSSIPS